MNVKVGDKVRFLNDVGGGVVVKILDRNRVMVLNEDDFEVPSMISEIVVVESVADKQLKNNKIEQINRLSKPKPSNFDNDEFDDDEEDNSTIINNSGLEEAIFYPDVQIIKSNGDNLREFLAFTKNVTNDTFQVFLINDSNYNVLYNIATTNQDSVAKSEATGILEANTKVMLSTISLSSVNTLPAYVCQLLFYRKGDFKIKQPLMKVVEINPVKFYKEASFTKNEFFEENAMMIRLIDEKADADSLENITQKEFAALVGSKMNAKIDKDKKEHKGFSPKRKNEIVEIDLHIHELLDDHRGLSRNDILEIQLKKFRDELENAIRNHVKKIVFIHGVGEGVLKVKIRSELDKKRKILDYQDASFKEYGYGATMVRIF